MPWNVDLRRRLLVGTIPCAALLLIVSATINHQWSRSTLDRESRQELNQEWAAMKGFLRLEKDPQTQRIEDHWFYNTNDPDETEFVSRLQARCLIMDEGGRTLRDSPAFQAIGTNFPSKIRLRLLDFVNSPNRGTAFWMYERTTQNLLYIIRAGFVFDESRGSPYYVAMAAPLSHHIEALHVFDYTSIGVLIGALVLGWSLGRMFPQRSPVQM
jgi:hypothetical protein